MAIRSPHGGLQSAAVRAALYYARKRRLARLTSSEGSFTPAASTVFLLSARNGVAEDLAGGVDVIANGDATVITTESPFADNRSLGTNLNSTTDVNDYFSVTLASSLADAWTIEGFLYRRGQDDNYMGLLGSGLPFQIGHTTVGTTRMHMYAAGDFRADSNAALSLDTWVHFAFVKTAGNVITLYIDGVAQIALATNTHDVTVPASFDIGRASDASDNASWYGYFDEIRISNEALYTENFSAPTERFSE